MSELDLIKLIIRIYDNKTNQIFPSFKFNKKMYMIYKNL